MHILTQKWDSFNDCVNNLSCMCNLNFLADFVILPKDGLLHFFFHSQYSWIHRPSPFFVKDFLYWYNLNSIGLRNSNSFRIWSTCLSWRLIFKRNLWTPIFALLLSSLISGYGIWWYYLKCNFKINSQAVHFEVSTVRWFVFKQF